MSNVWFSLRAIRGGSPEPVWQVFFFGGTLWSMPILLVVPFKDDGLLDAVYEKIVNYFLEFLSGGFSSLSHRNSNWRAGQILRTG